MMHDEADAERASAAVDAPPLSAATPADSASPAPGSDAVAALLLPVRPDAPCGDDLDLSPEFDRIRELRRQDDPTLAQGDWAHPPKLADWTGTAQACETLLRTRTKDLRLVAWLLEAWTRLRGAEGLADALTLARALCERFWPELHPRLDDDGNAELRTGALARLLAPVASLAAQGPGDALERACEELDGLQRVVDRHLPDGPAFERTRAALHSARRAAARRSSPASGARPPGCDGTEWGADAEHAAPPCGAPAPAGTVEGAEPARPGSRLVTGSAPLAGPRHRAEAVAQLRDIAAYFRAAEPHNPVAYLAERAACWAEQPLHAWLREVVTDEVTLARLEELLALPPR